MEVSRGAMTCRAMCALLLAAAVIAGADEVMAQDQARETVLASVDVRMTHRVLERDGSQAWPMPTPTAFTLQKLRTASGETRFALAYQPTPGGLERETASLPSFAPGSHLRGRAEISRCRASGREKGGP